MVEDAENLGIQLNKDTYINNILLLIVQESEDRLQRSIYKLNTICQEYRPNVKMSTNDTKIMAFKQKESVRSKVNINNQTYYE